MGKLDDFLGLSDVSQINKDVVFKFNGKEFTIKVRPLTEEEHGEFQKRCQNFNKNKISFDSSKYNNLLLNHCIVEPNFNDAEFLAKVGCNNGVEFLSKKFPAGVLTEISSQIQVISGFESFEAEIENAKN